MTLEDFDYALRVEYIFENQYPDIANNLDEYVSMTTSQAIQTWVVDSNGTAHLNLVRQLLTLGPCTNGRMGL